MAQTKQLLWKMWFSTATRSRISTVLPHFGWSQRLVKITEEVLLIAPAYKMQSKLKTTGTSDQINLYIRFWGLLAISQPSRWDNRPDSVNRQSFSQIIWTTPSPLLRIILNFICHLSKLGSQSADPIGSMGQTKGLFSSSLISFWVNTINLNKLYRKTNCGVMICLTWVSYFTYGINKP